MLDKVKKNLKKPSVWIALTALFFALSGGAYATSQLIDGRNIKKGTIGEAQLNRRSRAKLNRRAQRGPPGPQGLQGPAGPAGAKGADGVDGNDGKTGATGSQGPQGLAGRDGAPGRDGKDGEDGQDGQDGTDGTPGRDGLNPATPVKQDGDEGWRLVGQPAASFINGALRLGGGHDGTTSIGAIGITHEYPHVPLGTLSALKYDYSIVRRPAGNSVSAPTIHITVRGADRFDGDPNNTGGFSNLVCEPYRLGATQLYVSYSVDARECLWWSTARLVDGTNQSNPKTLREIWDADADKDLVIEAISFDNGGSSQGTIPPDALAMDVNSATVGFNGQWERLDFGG